MLIKQKVINKVWLKTNNSHSSYINNQREKDKKRAFAIANRHQKETLVTNLIKFVAV
jgi:hypothetical protein